MKLLVVGLGLVGSLLSHAGMPVMNPGTPDAAIMLQGHPVQLQYLALVGRDDVVWFEDGSGEDRTLFERQRAHYFALLAGDHPQHAR